MVIDLDALRNAAGGGPGRKVEVTRAWLAVVHAELRELERRRAADRDGPEAARMREAFGRMFGERP